MATKTSSKTASRKPAPKAFGAAPKTTAAPKPAAAPKSKVPKKESKSDVPHGSVAATAASKSRGLPAEKSEAVSGTALGHEVESVSLIDRKKPRKKTEDGEPKTRRDVLPPISRIRASLEATTAPPKPAAPIEATPPTPAPSAIAVDTAVPAATPPGEAEAAPQKIILIKPPIVVKQLATELGLKPHQLIAELMTYNIFANINQTVEPDIASKIAENHGFILEKERREKGAGVHKV